MPNVQEKVSNVTEQMRNVTEQAMEAAQSVTSKVTDFFQGNPFDTPVGRKIEMATDATKLNTENWGLNMEICDFINYTNEGGRDAIRAIRKRLQTQMGKNNAIVMYTLTVLETAVKNGDQRFKALVCQKEFVTDLVKLISSKYDVPQIIQERILGLIQAWADAFQNNPACSGVFEMYEELRAKGVEFPATDLDKMVPIDTPKRTVFKDEPAATKNTSTEGRERENAPAPDARTYHLGPTSTQPSTITGEQMAKLRSELDVVKVNITVLRELLGTLKSGPESTSAKNEDYQLMEELVVTCREMHKRILELIPIITNEEITSELLSLNDELNAVLEKYDRHIQNQTSHEMSMIPSGSGTQNFACKSEDGTKATGDLIDLSSEAGVSSQLKTMDIKGTANMNYENESLAEVGLKTAAFDKTTPINERQNQQKKLCG